jgi:MauM/NapG family ferredoxin protein
MKATPATAQRWRWRLWLWGRRLSQAVFLLLFLFLFLRYRYQDQASLEGPIHLFFRLDPLLFLAYTLSSWKWSAFFWPALLVVPLTLLLGRFFCGWLCPLGSLLDGVGAGLNSGRKVQPDHLAMGWRRVKYVLLVALLVTALFRFDWIGIFDPLSVLFRSLALALYPAAAYTGERFFDLAFAVAPESWVDSLDSVYGMIKGAILPARALSYQLLLFTGAVFVALLLLELVERRFWCKNLCPLGALLGILARWRRLKRVPAKACTDCGDCRSMCKMDSFAAEGGWQNVRECILCLSCGVTCREDRVRYGFGILTSSRPHVDLGRRRLVLGAVGAACALPLLKLDGGVLEAGVIRPPGALPEGEFLSRCVRCGACMKVCVTNGLQPLFLERGLAGLWSPALIPRHGYCEFHCTLCGQACPTGAIPPLALKRKQQTVIGKAVIDPSRCIPYARGKNCLVCEEHCPTAPKAIVLRRRERLDPHDRAQIVMEPVVLDDRCIGCGICETKCPVEGTAAGIRVRPPTATELRLQKG